MRLRTRVIFTTTITLFTAFCWSVGPYWTAKLHSRETPKGDLAQRQVSEDACESFVARALLGGAIGFVISLIPITTRRGRAAAAYPASGQGVAGGAGVADSAAQRRWVR